MKKIAAITIIVLIRASLLQAHEMEGGSTRGLFGLKAEYIHVLLNPLPVYGLFIGLLVLSVGLFTRSRGVRNMGLALVFWKQAELF